MTKIYDYQKEGANFLASRWSALLADDMGLGKTVQAILAANKISTRWPKILIVCPASVKIHWENELDKWTHTSHIQILYGRDTKFNPHSQVHIINYDLLLSKGLQGQWQNLKWDVGIFDEAHYIKNMEAKRTRAILAKGGLARSCNRRWFLTGTPVLNRPIEFYPILRVCHSQGLEPYSTYEKYAYRFCAGVMGEYGLDASGASNLDDLKKRLDGFMLRRTKKQVKLQLPKVTYQYIDMEMDDRMKKCIEDFEEWELLGDYDPEVQMELGQTAKFRRAFGISKVRAISRHATQALDEGQKVVIFAYHRDVIMGLKTHLFKYNPVTYLGGMNIHQKQEVVHKFQNESQVFIGQVKAAGTGLDGLQKVCSTIMFAEMDWTPGIMDQAVGRLDRIGQSNPVLVQFLVVGKTIESQMVRTLWRKRNTIKELLG
jgi:SWI/SNF-related matrix-associated actin-dependent regulator of chromatin subfamily A-like protein 1